MTQLTPDELSERFANSGEAVRICMLDAETVLIEGSQIGLENLARLIAAQAASTDCGFQFSPNGPGSRLFRSGSTLGVYIHRVPCDHAEDSVSGA
jgi:hypothetical protein